MKAVNILLAEDDQLDVMNIKRSLDKLNIVYQLTNAKNGEEAIASLCKTEQNGKQLPDIVLIDINMPKMNGLELLETIRHHDNWKSLKCFIVTSSDQKVDRKAAEKLGVAGYITKPLSINSPRSMDAFNLMIDLMNM